MQLDSVREVKATLREDGGVRAVDAGFAALGVAVGGPGGFRLAVRVADDAAASSAWVSDARRVARGEVEVRTVGRIRALGSGPGAPPGPGMPGQAPPWYQGRIRPLRIGASVGHPRVTAGTIGAFVRDVDRRLALLSNSHVIADEGRAPVGDGVHQPGPADGGEVADRVATLAAVVPYDTARPNLVDCATATLDDGVEADLRRIGDEGDLAGLEEDVTAGDRVVKAGRTTGTTRGRVTAFELDGLDVAFGTGSLRFDDQIEVVGDTGAFSAGGDSGSMVCTLDGLLGYALLFAGSEVGGADGSGVTYCNPLGRVLTTLGVELAT